MHDIDELTDEDSSHLTRILIEARQVTLRHQFFNWAQGPVQSLIPHDILLCGLTDDSGYLLHERFTACRYFKDEHFHQATHPGKGLIGGLVLEWQAANPPRHFASPPSVAEGRSDSLIELELKNLIFQGMGWVNGPLKGYASFSRVRAPFDPRLDLCIDMLLPTLLATLARVLAHEARAGGDARSPNSLVTAREIEVLAWVRDGKTNDEIAAILGLSMLTVKNHLRNAMKKLDVRTRGQAVAKVIALGVIHAQSGSQRIPN
ncbi:MAG: XrtB/PEP-CTERM-associated transcriptional regulator EpsA [Thiobacillus sp.]